MVQTVSLAAALQYLLQRAVMHLYRDMLRDTPCLQQICPAPRLLQLNVRQSYPVLYSSAVALKLARYVGSAHRVAKTLINSIAAPVQQNNFLDSSPGIELEWLLPHLSTRLQPDGWIEMQIASTGIACWLNRILGLTLPAPPTAVESMVSVPIETIDFCALHAHARCCSILRLAKERERDAEINSAHILPWLDGPRLRLVGSARQGLLLRLIQTLDAVAALETEVGVHPFDGSRGGSLQRSYVRGLKAVATAFDRYHACCHPLTPEAALPRSGIQADLGVIQVTQRVLALFLSRLGIEAPTAL